MKKLISFSYLIVCLWANISYASISEPTIYVGADGYNGTSPQTLAISPTGSISTYINGYDPLFTDAQSNVYYSSGGNIYKYTPQGVTSLFHIDNISGIANDFEGNTYFNLSGSFYKLNSVTGGLDLAFNSTYAGGAIAYNPNGYFVGIQSNSFVRINTDGTVQNIVLNTFYGFSQSHFTVDSVGNIYYDNPGSGQVYKIGSNMNATSINTGNFSMPLGLTADKNGNVFIADWSNRDVVKIQSDGTQSIYASGLNYPGSIVLSPVSVPEPSTYALFGIGTIGMLLVIRRKKTT